MPSSRTRRARARRPRVAVLGGGIGGLSAALELAERGFAVTVFERRDRFGGKARSIPVPGTGTCGRPDLPGEHGFRFFPGFYRHLPDTMRRIPYRGQPDGVYGNLVQAPRFVWWRDDGRSVSLPTTFPRNPADWRLMVGHLTGSVHHEIFGVPREEARYLARRLGMVLTSCTARRYGELEHRTWWEHAGAASRSRPYQSYLCENMAKILVAVRGREISARTGGTIVAQLMLDLFRGERSNTRILNGPTTATLVAPWRHHLEQLGVVMRTGATVTRLSASDGRITSVTVEEAGRTYEVEADHYVAAVPLEVMQRLATPELCEEAPELCGLANLRTAWMTGLQLYFDRPVASHPGHDVFCDSPWALTSVAQQQFWSCLDLADCGDATVRDVISVDVSDWNTPGLLTGRPARECTPDEIRDEVLAQMRAHLTGPALHRLESARLLAGHLDPAIRYAPGGRTVNEEPLFINTAGSWAHRPNAVTSLDNLFLASDYVRTHTDLATMEAANEAARRAVNGILAASSVSAPACAVYPLSEPAFLRPLRALDHVRYARGLPHVAEDHPEMLDPVLARAG